MLALERFVLGSIIFSSANAFQCSTPRYLGPRSREAQHSGVSRSLAGRGRCRVRREGVAPIEGAVKAVGAIEHGIEATVAASGAGLGSLLFAFVAGGLFFSTALAAAGAVYAFGVGNVRSGLALLGLVARRVLRISGAVLKASQVALVGPGIRDRRGWRFREAWLVLRCD